MGEEARAREGRTGLIDRSPDQLSRAGSRDGERGIAGPVASDRASRGVRAVDRADLGRDARSLLRVALRRVATVRAAARAVGTGGSPPETTRKVTSSSATARTAAMTLDGEARMWAAQVRAWPAPVSAPPSS